MHLAPERGEVLGRRRQVQHLDVAVGAQVHEALEPGETVLAWLARIASKLPETMEPAELIADWQAGLRLRGISNRQVIDWLPWWDNSLLLALRPHLPGGMLLVALRGIGLHVGTGQEQRL